MRRSYFDIADGQIHARIRAGGSGTVLLLHQTASSGAMWEKVMARWPADQRLVAVDTPGFGSSFDPLEAPSMDDYVRWTLDVINQLGAECVHVVGHHTGAAVGLALAVSAPAKVASLAMIGPSCLDEAEREEFSRRLGRPFKPSRSGAYLLQNWEYLRVGGANADVGLLHREMIDMLRAWSSRPQAYGAVWSQDFAALLGQVSCPILLMAARDDMMFPYLARAIALRPDAKIAVLEAGANFEPDLVPDEVTHALAAFVLHSSGQQ